MGDVHAGRVCGYAAAFPAGRNAVLRRMEFSLWRLPRRSVLGLLLVHAQGIGAGICDDVDSLDPAALPGGSAHGYLLEHPHPAVFCEPGAGGPVGNDLLTTE